MPPKQVESLIAALSDDKFLEALQGILQPIITLAIDSSLNSLRQELKQRDGQITVLVKENKELKVKLQTQGDYLNQLETYTKQENLIIQGLPLASYAESANAQHSDANDTALEHESSSTTELAVLRLCNEKLGIDITPNDISVCHRLKKSPKMQHPAVIVRFTNLKAREALLNARKKLRDIPGNRIFVNEHLTKVTSAMFAEARKLVKSKKLQRTWTTHGQVVVKRLDGTNLNIKSMSELHQFE